MHTLKILGIVALCVWAYAFIGVQFSKGDITEHQGMSWDAGDWVVVIISTLAWPIWEIVKPFIRRTL